MAKSQEIREFLSSQGGEPVRRRSEPRASEAAPAHDGVLVRRAVDSDAQPACDLVRRSIAELCAADHRGDPLTIEAWLANKRVEEFLRLISLTEKYCAVAVRGGVVQGYGHLDRSGEIGLLYVAPEARFRGVSHAILQALEAEADRAGTAILYLDSSLTARRFYEARGYRVSGAPKPGFGVTWRYPMEKRLVCLR